MGIISDPSLYTNFSDLAWGGYLQDKGGDFKIKYSQRGNSDFVSDPFSRANPNRDGTSTYSWQRKDKPQEISVTFPNTISSNEGKQICESIWSDTAWMKLPREHPLLNHSISTRLPEK